MTQHTDRSQLEALYRMPAIETLAPRWRRWGDAAWAWLSESVTILTIVNDPALEAARRRIKVYKVALKGAERLSRYERSEAQEVLRVTAMLLGFGRKR